MNMSQSPDLRFSALKENSILSFNAASKFPLDFIEFDVQVFTYFFQSSLRSRFAAFEFRSASFFFFNLVQPRDRRQYHVGCLIR